jgi:hypothetical protein
MRYILVVESEAPLDEMLSEYDWVVISAVDDPDNQDYPEGFDEEVQILSIVKGDFFK